MESRCITEVHAASRSAGRLFRFCRLSPGGARGSADRHRKHVQSVTYDYLRTVESAAEPPADNLMKAEAEGNDGLLEAIFQKCAP